MKKGLIFILTLTLFVSVFFMGTSTKADMVETSPGSLEYYEEVELSKVILGTETSYALTEDGRLFGWGYNSYGVIGDGTDIDRLAPVDVTRNFELDDFEKIIKADFGNTLSVVLTNFGRVFTWGNNSGGQLGDGASADTLIPVDITENFALEVDDMIVDIEVGGDNSFALTESGDLFAWGSNENGKLGDGTEDDQYLPINVIDNIGLYYYETIEMMSLGGEHSMIVTSSGRLISWGANGEGELGDGSSTTNSTPTDVTSYLGLHTEEVVVQAIAGYGTSMALTSEGRVMTWGNNEYGQMADGTLESKSSPVDVTANFSFEEDEYIIEASTVEGFVIALTNQNRVFTWGYNDDGQLGTGDSTQYPLPQDITLVLGLAPTEGIINVDASYYNSTVLTDTGRCLIWGYNGQGQIGDGTKTDSLIPIDIQDNFRITSIMEASLAHDETIVDVSIGKYHYAAVTSYGNLFTWGDNFFGQLGDGTVLNTNQPMNITNQFNLAEVEKIIDVELGEYHSVALTNTGRVFTWGENEIGQLGNMSTTDLYVPTELPASDFGSEGVVSITVYDKMNAAMTASGRLFTWGFNWHGELGDGTEVHKLVPTEVTGNFGLAVDETIEKISFGLYHTALITSAGRLFTWGNNSYGELGTGTTSIVPTLIPTELSLSNFGGHPIVDVSAGYHTTAVVTDTGKLYTWGLNNVGQLGHGTTTNSSVPVEVLSTNFDDETVESVNLGFQHTTAITSSGTLYAWGLNNVGQLGDGTFIRKTSPQAIPMFDGTETFAQASPGQETALAITDDGVMYRWGRASIGENGFENQLRDYVPVRKFDMNTIEYIYSALTIEYYSDVIPVSIFPTFNIGDQLFSITISGIEYLVDELTVSNGRIDLELDNTGVINEVFDIEIDSISYVEGVQTPVTGYTSKSVVMMDLEAPTFDEIEDQIVEAGTPPIDWTEFVENLDDNSDMFVIIGVETDIYSYGIIGDYTVTMTAKDVSGNETSQTFAVEIVDTTPPVVTVTGQVIFNLELGEWYHDGGARFSDNADGEGNAYLTEDTVMVDSGTIGTYILYYTYTDTSGNTSVTVSRTVIVADTIAPAVTGVINDEVFENGSEVTITFEEGTATLNDEEFTSGTVVTEPGEYTLVVTDVYGNANTTVFTIESSSHVVLILIIGVAVIAVGAGGFLLAKKYLRKV